MVTFLRVWTPPFLLAALGFGGLIGALVGDGPWDIASSVSLALLPALVGWFHFFKHAR